MNIVSNPNISGSSPIEINDNSIEMGMGASDSQGTGKMLSKW